MTAGITNSIKHKNRLYRNLLKPSTGANKLHFRKYFENWTTWYALLKEITTMKYSMAAIMT